jgi:hypothetical protein
VPSHTLKSNAFIYRKVELACKQSIEQKDSKPTPATSKTLYVKDDDEPRAFVISIEPPVDYFTINLERSITSYARYNSFILDSGATVHCCNQKEQFYNLTPAGVDNILFTRSD